MRDEAGEYKLDKLIDKVIFATIEEISDDLREQFYDHKRRSEGQINFEVGGETFSVREDEMPKDFNEQKVFIVKRFFDVKLDRYAENLRKMLKSPY
ncbi:MAG: hypothetical protein Q7S53_05570 [bacterium]|nr:hypothetical protein [bacterium]